MTNCFSCGKAFSFDKNYRIGRKEECPHCGSDVHVCKNCEYYDTTAYNECRETSAERVVDKERSNFCDYFQMSLSSDGGAASSDSSKNAFDELEKLFK